MRRALNKRDVDILEEKGLWEAHSYLHRVMKRVMRKRLPVELRYIKDAHRITFSVARQPEIGGRYRRDNGPELRRIDGTPLKISDWRQVPSDIAELDWLVREDTKNLREPRTEEEYRHLICLAARHSHRLATIHPFRNGNGRASRLLIDAILIRGGLSAIAVKKKKSQYLRAMRQADDGDFSALENIIADGLREHKERLYHMTLIKHAEHRRTGRRSKGRNIK